MGLDLRLQPVTAAAYVSQQISPIYCGMSFDSEKSHRDPTIRAPREFKTFGSGRGKLAHVVALGLMVAGVQQEPLKAFDKFITARQVRPGSLHVEQVCLPCGIARVLGALRAVRCALVTLCDMPGQPLKHLHAYHSTNRLRSSILYCQHLL